VLFLHGFPTSSYLWNDVVRFMPDGYRLIVLDQLGFAVTVNTDNRLMSGTTLSREIAVLAEVFGYTLDDIREFQITAAGAAFIPADERVELIAMLDERFDNA
jgi:adenosine deaminase